MGELNIQDRKRIVTELVSEYLEDASLIVTYWCVVQQLKQKFEERDNFVILELKRK
jgi:hypothetical protein